MTNDVGHLLLSIFPLRSSPLTSSRLVWRSLPCRCCLLYISWILSLGRFKEHYLINEVDSSVFTGYRTLDERTGRLRDFRAPLSQMAEEDGIHGLCQRSQLSLYASMLGDRVSPNEIYETMIPNTKQFELILIFTDLDKTVPDLIPPERSVARWGSPHGKAIVSPKREVGEQDGGFTYGMPHPRTSCSVSGDHWIGGG